MTATPQHGFRALTGMRDVLAPESSRRRALVDTFARAAQAAGCRTSDGMGMLVNQGVIGIKLWTGVDVDAGVMRQALLDLKL